MARGRFRALNQLLPTALDGLAQRAATGGALGPAWAQAAGAQIARVSRPLSLEGGTLRVEVDGDAWLKELQGRAAELLLRLEGPFGGRVKRLAFAASRKT